MTAVPIPPEPQPEDMRGEATKLCPETPPCGVCRGRAASPSGDVHSDWLRAVRAEAWDRGYLSGTLDAASDLAADNPYRAAELRSGS